MRKIWLGLALGGVIGAGAGVALAEREGSEGHNSLVRQAAVAGGATAGAGALMGLALDRRSRRRARVTSPVELLTGGEIIGAARALAPAARELIHHATETTRPRIEAVAEAAKPRLEALAKARTAASLAV